MSDMHMHFNLEDMNEIIPHLAALSSASRRTQQQTADLIKGLPQLTEEDLLKAGHQESLCPICFNPFLAIIAEEEMALAMDSPAHPPELLGVTKLSESCGHIFCRRELSVEFHAFILKWINDAHDSCPTCRRPFIPTDPNNDERDTTTPQAPNIFGGLDGLILNNDLEPFRQYARHLSRLDGRTDNSTNQSSRDDSHNDDAHEFAGMYS
ncbi:hypothetical protein SERLA73DRAFT_79122 [Serpula lacrymans var. lacrymans S7.3]|uniref:RING-type domain-containing protein n=1 Tax=Serpula lacrymans var. lacrymans (strain S7.3) TaxID=936435 RepID=F8QFC1_SERL3|nr:hypothetical protein SERLA73DRAFT_79122 [Serpula lacrymans var. lacrymans S7.3]